MLAEQYILDHFPGKTKVTHQYKQRVGGTLPIRLNQEWILFTELALF